MKRLVVYHADCSDGFTAAWALWKAFGQDDTEYLPARYGGAPPNVTSYDAVYVVDFSYPRAQLVEMDQTVGGTLVVLDHHKTAQADLVDLSFCTFDMNRSGAGLVWDEVAGPLARCPRPLMVDYVEDRDLWRHWLPDSRKINAYIGTLPRVFEVWERTAQRLQHDYYDVVKAGEGVLLGVEAYVREMQKLASLHEVYWQEGDLRYIAVVPVVNCPPMSASELVGALAEGPAFAVGWHQRADGQYVYSLRSRGDGGEDVSVIAKWWGGGGHKNAAGFTYHIEPSRLFSVGPRDD